MAEADKISSAILFEIPYHCIGFEFLRVIELFSTFTFVCICFGTVTTIDIIKYL